MTHPLQLANRKHHTNQTVKGGLGELLQGEDDTEGGADL